MDVEEELIPKWPSANTSRKDFKLLSIKPIFKYIN